jgi:flagellar basal body-associated protein FliL
MSTTPPAPPPGPPSTPPPGPPSTPPPGPPSAPPPGPPSAPPPGATPGAAPPKKSGAGTNIWLVLFIVVGVLFFAALIFAIFSFTGKNSEADDKEKAQKELASTKKELNDTQAELGTQQGAGQILSDLVRTGAKSADDLKACTDSAKDVQNRAIDVLNQRQAGTDVNPQIDGLNAAIDENERLCDASTQSYQAFIDALDEVRNR